MSLKLLALILSLIAMTVSLTHPSDAYQVGYAEGRFDLHTESRAIKKFNECVSEKKESTRSLLVRSDSLDKGSLSDLGCND